jgi:hypothetical protein
MSVKKWYWIGRLTREEREWPNDDLPAEAEPMPKWAFGLSALVVALALAYALYVLGTT